MANWTRALLLASTLSAYLACASGEDAEGGSSASSEGEKLCVAFSNRVKACSAQATPCDQVLIDDCAKVVDILSQPFLHSARVCLEAGGSPGGCFSQALSGLSASSTQQSLIAKFCDDCALGVSGCETSPPMKAVLPFSDSVAAELESQCTSGLTCGAQFPSCAQQVLATQALPSESAKCLFEMLLDGGSSSGGCSVDGGSGGSGGSGGAQGGTGGSGNFGGTSSGGTGALGGAGGTSAGGGTGGVGNTGGTGATGGGTGGGGTGGGTCTDAGTEPNDTPATATWACTPSPCNVTDSDGEGSDKKGVVTGVISSTDVDYFKFAGEDTWGDVAKAAASTSGGGFRLCVFVSCKGGSIAELKGCENGSTTATSPPTGLVGCCSTSGDVQVDHNCSGLDESANVYLRVDQATVCTPYNLAWHF